MTLLKLKLVAKYFDDQLIIPVFLKGNIFWLLNVLKCHLRQQNEECLSSGLLVGSGKKFEVDIAVRIYFTILNYFFYSLNDRSVSEIASGIAIT